MALLLKIASQPLIKEHANAVIVSKTLATFLSSTASSATRVRSQSFAGAPEVIVVGIREAFDTTHVAFTPDEQPTRQQTS